MADFGGGIHNIHVLNLMLGRGYFKTQWEEDF